MEPTHQQDSEALSAAAASSNNGGSPPIMNDGEIARRYAAVEQLTAVFGFDEESAFLAVDAVGAAEDISLCYNYILDQGLGHDKGGPVNPTCDCPHVKRHVRLGAHELPERPHKLPCTYNNNMSASAINNNNNNKKSAPARLKSEVQDDGTSCPAVENWLCLECGAVNCSRYVNAHGLAHWKETQQEVDDNEEEEEDAAAAAAAAEGHCIAVSLADLSVWCHVCNAYCRDPDVIDPLVRRLEELKFADDDDTNKNDSGRLLSRVENSSDHSRVEGPHRKKARLPEEDSSDSDEESAVNAQQQDYDRRSGGDDSDDHSDGEEAEDDDDDEESNNEEEEKLEVSLGSMNDESLLRLLTSVSAARGIPLQFLLQTAGIESEEDDSDDDDIAYPFDTPPTSLKDVADFIRSDKCRKILILTGAGISVCSGIPDYRSADGFYATMAVDAITATTSQREAIRADQTVALQQPLFLENPLPCLELKRDFILGTAEHRWKATLAHRFAELLHRNTGKLARVYTMNIDGLQDQCTDLPRQKVIAVHGSMDRAECAHCGAEADFDEFCDEVRQNIKDVTGNDASAPVESRPINCTECGRPTMKPAIVLFRSSLPPRFFESVPGDTDGTDLLLIMGTSLQVAPANSLIWRVPKTCMRVLINREPVGEQLGMRFGEESRRDYFGAGDCEDVTLDLLYHLGWLQHLETLLSGAHLPVISAEKLRERLSRLSAV